MEHGQRTPSAPPPEMPQFEAPSMPFGTQEGRAPSGWTEPAMQGPPVDAASTSAMNAWSEWSIGVAALSLFGLILGLVVLPRALDAGLAGTSTTRPLTVLMSMAMWVLAFGLVSLGLATVGAWRARQDEPSAPLGEAAVVPLLLASLPLVLLVAFMLALTSG